MEAVLSPNGQSRFDGGAPPTKLIVATATGIKILEREKLGAPWELAATALEQYHISTMTMLPGRHGVFAGTHGDGIFWSTDGHSWSPRNEGLHIKDIYTLAAVMEDGAVVIYA